MPPKTVTVTRAEAGQKLLQFLERRTGGGVPRSGIMRWIRTGQVRVDGGRKKPFFRLKEGMEVRIPPYTPGEKREQPVPRGLDIVFEDDDLLVIAKPAGLPVHGGSGHDDSITARLNGVFRGADFVPALVHRLDRDTSGLLVAGKTYAEVRRLGDLFAGKGDGALAGLGTKAVAEEGACVGQGSACDGENAADGGHFHSGDAVGPGDTPSAGDAQHPVEESDVAHGGCDGVAGVAGVAEEREVDSPAEKRGIDKVYLCWVQGEFPEGVVLLEDELEKTADKQGVEKVRSGSGKVALAEAVRVEMHGAGTDRCRSLLAVRLITGRTHQIRVQLAQRGYPLAGDRKYGPADTTAPTLMLHAFLLRLPGQRFQLVPPWSGSWAVGEEALERAARELF